MLKQSIAKTLSCAVLLAALSSLPVSAADGITPADDIAAKLGKGMGLQLRTQQAPAGQAPAEQAAVPPPSIDLPSVTFQFNSAELTPQARLQLEQVAMALRDPELTAFRFEIRGHTDAVGSNAYNLDLSERRARAAVAFLVSDMGIEAQRLRPVGFGEDLLLPGVDPADGANRRVEIVNLGQ